MIRTGTLLAAILLCAASSPYATSYLYVWGNGPSGNVTVYMAPITGPGVIGAWGVQTNYPVAMKEPYGFTDATHLYSFGGGTGAGVIADVYTSPLGGGGTLGAWTTQTALPAPRYQIVTLTDGAGFAYAMGGSTSGCCSGTNNCWSAAVAGGAVGAWSVQTNLPGALAEHGGAYSGGYLFIAGGWNGGSPSNAVWSASAAGGVVGAWNAQANLANPTTYLWLSACCGCLYSVAGLVGGGGTNNVYYAWPSNGTISAWNATTSLPISVYESAAVCVDGYLYEVGGCPCSTAAVYSAQILGGGGLGAWSSQTALPVVMAEVGIASWTTGTPTPCAAAGSPTNSFTSTRTGTVSETTSPTATSSRTGTATETHTITQGQPSWTYTATRTLSGSPTPTLPASPTPTFTPVPPSATVTATIVPPTATPTLAPSWTSTQIAVPPPPTATPTFPSPPPFFWVNQNAIGPGESVEITWAVAETGPVQITAFNSAGEFVRSLVSANSNAMTAYTIKWDGTSDRGEPVSSNIYLLRMTASKFLQIRRLGIQR